MCLCARECVYVCVTLLLTVDVRVVLLCTLIAVEGHMDPYTKWFKSSNKHYLDLMHTLLAHTDASFWGSKPVISIFLCM